MSNKIKIAWICEFSSEFIQNNIPLWKKTPPYGAWISTTLEGFKNSKEFEIHVISPHQYLKKDYSFEDEGVFYHFFSAGIPFIKRTWPPFFNLDLFTNYYFYTRKIRRIIRKIKPALINLHGAEVPRHSSSVLELYQQYPVLVSIQGFISLDVYGQNDSLKKKRIQVESEIIQKCSYFGGDADSKLIIKNMRGTDFEYYNYYYPIGSHIEKFAELSMPKEFDLLFWGRIVKDKGAEDFLALVSKLKANFPGIKACYIGPVGSAYFEFLKEQAVKLGCEKNILFKGFIRSDEELYTTVLKARILVTPTYNDRFPTVIREAVCLRLNVISYSTGSIPQFNNGEERILLTKQGNIENLVRHAEKLMTDHPYFDELSAKAYQHGVEEFSVKCNCDKMMCAYRDILQKKSTTI